MKKEIAAMVAIVLILLAPILVMAAPDSSIVVDDADNKVKYSKFDSGDQWSITIRDAITNKIAYQFSGTIGDEQAGNNAFVWFEEVSPGALKFGVHECVVAGSYNLHAEGTHNGVTYTKDGPLTVTEQEACEPPIPPVPELSTVVLVSTGIFGMILVSRKYK